MKKSGLTVPKHLSADAKTMWRRLMEDFHLEDAAALALLRAACEAFDRCNEARQQIAKEGATLKDRFGQVRAHPAVAVERDARGQMISALRALRLDPGVLE